jgi:hypothetical protein
MIFLEQWNLEFCDAWIKWLKIGNTNNAWSRTTQPAACLQATGSTRHAVCGGISNQKTSFKSSPGNAEREWWNILQTYELFIYGDIHSVTNSFCKNVLKMVIHQPRLWPAFFNKCILFSVHLYSTQYIDKYTGKYIQIIAQTLTHSSFCVFNFMLPSCRPNFAIVSHTTKKV